MQDCCQDVLGDRPWLRNLFFPSPAEQPGDLITVETHSKTYHRFPGALDEGREDHSTPRLRVFVQGAESFIEITSISTIVAFKFRTSTGVIAVFYEANLIKQAIF